MTNSTVRVNVLKKHGASNIVTAMAGHNLCVNLPVGNLVGNRAPFTVGNCVGNWSELPGVSVTPWGAVLNGPATPSEVQAAATHLMRDANLKHRKNGVRCIEILVSFHPDFFDRLNVVVEAVRSVEAWAADPAGEEWPSRFGVLLSTVLHLYEGAPHAHILLLPLVAGRMRGSDMLGGTRRLAFHIRTVAALLDPLGLVAVGVPVESDGHHGPRTLNAVQKLALTRGKGPNTHAEAAIRDAALMALPDGETVDGVEASLPCVGNQSMEPANHIDKGSENSRVSPAEGNEEQNADAVAAYADDRLAERRAAQHESAEPKASRGDAASEIAAVEHALGAAHAEIQALKAQVSSANTEVLDLRQKMGAGMAAASADLIRDRESAALRTEVLAHINSDVAPEGVLADAIALQRAMAGGGWHSLVDIDALGLPGLRGLGNKRVYQALGVLKAASRVEEGHFSAGNGTPSRGFRAIGPDVDQADRLRCAELDAKNEAILLALLTYDWITPTEIATSKVPGLIRTQVVRDALDRLVARGQVQRRKGRQRGSWEYRSSLGIDQPTSTTDEQQSLPDMLLVVTSRSNNNDTNIDQSATWM